MRKIVYFPTLLLLNSCSALPTLSNDIEKMIDDDMITISISREAMTQNTDVDVAVSIRNQKPNN